MSTTQTAVPAALWTVDPVHSSAEFAVKYMVSTFRAPFTKVDATLDTTGDVPVLRGSVDPTSVQVKDENFHAHLQGADFFDSAAHPAITFESRDVRIDDDRVVVDGTLTIKGHAQPLEARGTFVEPFEDPFGGTRIGLTLEASVDRTHFDVSWNAPLPKGGVALANEVKLHVELQLVKA